MLVSSFSSNASLTSNVIKECNKKDNWSIRSTRIALGAVGGAFVLGGAFMFWNSLSSKEFHTGEYNCRVPLMGPTYVFYQDLPYEIQKNCHPIYRQANLADKIFSVVFAVPMIFGTAMCLDSLSRVEYDNPRILSKLKLEALQMSLQEIVKKHGWENLIRYQIITPAQFDKLFFSYANQVSFKEMLKVYREAAPYLVLDKEFTFPSLTIWKDRFLSETGQLSCCEILKNYPGLTEYAFFSTEQQQALVETEIEECSYRRKKSMLEDKFILDAWDAHKAFCFIRKDGKYYYTFYDDTPPFESLFLKKNLKGEIEKTIYVCNQAESFDCKDKKFLMAEEKFLHDTKVLREKLDSELEALRIDHEKNIQKNNEDYLRGGQTNSSLSRFFLGK